MLLNQQTHLSLEVSEDSEMSPGKNKKNFKVFSSLEFIAAITQHIPEPSFQLVRYYGWYSNRMRGDRNKQKGRAEESGNKSLEKSKVIDVRNFKKTMSC